MYKKLFTGLLFVLFASSIYAQQQTDSVAIYVLKKVSSNFQTLQSCNFETQVFFDVYTEDLGCVQNEQKQDIVIKFPNKFKINSKGDKGHSALWYDGKKLTYYSFLRNEYAQRNAPNNIFTTIDTLSTHYGIDFPAGDFFYKDFVENLLSSGANLVFLGITEIDGKQCFHIVGKNDEISFQFWIADENVLVPVKVQLIYLNKEALPRYEVHYSNWKFNENIHESIFNFDVPPYATQIQFHSK